MTPTVLFGTSTPRSERTVRCGRKKCVEFILWRMGADTEIADYGGFTPLLNTGKPSHHTFSLPKKHKACYADWKTPVSRSLELRYSQRVCPPKMFLIRKNATSYECANFVLLYVFVIQLFVRNKPVDWSLQRAA